MRVTIQVQIVLPIVMGIMSLVYGQIVGGLILLGLAAIAALAFYLWSATLCLQSEIYPQS